MGKEPHFGSNVPVSSFGRNHTYDEAMPFPGKHSKPQIQETIRGIVDRVTFHNPDNGWSVLRVSTFDTPPRQETVTVHQTKVFAGATMAFKGAWTHHARFGRQFEASHAIEEKPATTAALEKYLGSGLIRGVGPKTAKKIVQHFGDSTLDVFEDAIEKLKEVRGIAEKKLDAIRSAWIEHRAIRKVMMFLQSHGVSTLFAVRIYKAYGDDAIDTVMEDPYRLADDFYGIGFFSADNIALSLGLENGSPKRIMAGIKHVLSAGREFGHCYLTESQIGKQVAELLALSLGKRLRPLLAQMERDGHVMIRTFSGTDGKTETCYYAKGLYFDEAYVAKKIVGMANRTAVDEGRIDSWLTRYSRATGMELSDEQSAAVRGMVKEGFSVLTGGPGCGKTTTTRVLVKLLEAMGRRVVLTAPTGRAAQRMADVIGREAKTIHRLLEWKGGQFKKGEDDYLRADAVIVDESSMLDISLTASLLKAVPPYCQVLFIGDADQLPSVGAGNVLRDIIASDRIPCFRLKKVFRQAEASLIVQYAHQINRGVMPAIDSPFQFPEKWKTADCLFVDSDEASKEQLNFITKVKRHLQPESVEPAPETYQFRVKESLPPHETELTIPEKFRHADLDSILAAQTHTDELLAVMKKVHPWSSLHYKLSALDVVEKLYTEWIPKYHARKEIQIITPMTRGSLGTLNLNRLIQKAANPPGKGKSQLLVGERILRVGDRVIHRRNNYDLEVFNGDIGVIKAIDTAELNCIVSFDAGKRKVVYQRDDIPELDLAYAITIHKSQGSEFETVIMPILSQHFKMLFRNLVYTGLTRAKTLAVLVGTRRALAIGIGNQDTSQRQTLLKELMQ